MQPLPPAPPSAVEVKPATALPYKPPPLPTVPVSHAEWRTPRSPAEISTLVAAKPSGWRHMLLAGVLYREMHRLEPWYLQFEAGHTWSTPFQLSSIRGFFDGRVEALRGMVDQVNALNHSAVLDAGTEEQVIALGAGVANTYEQMLGWSSGVRALHMADPYAGLLSWFALVAQQPIRQLRQFAIDLIVSADTLINEPQQRVTLNLTIGDEAIDLSVAEARRLSALGLWN
jgi:hypothetical protein